MQSTLVALLAILAAGVSAAPFNSMFDRATCDVKTCVIALKPSFPTACDPAALQLGANTPLNTACLVAAAEGTAAFPTACAPCAAQFGVTDPGNESGPATSGAIGNAAPATGGQGTVVTPAADENGQAKGPRAACDVQACVIALGPSFPLCAPAVKQLGADTSFNTVCLAAAAKGTAPFPAACEGCAAQFGVTDPGAGAQAAGMAIN
ncbi:hypothetical protein DFH08DRAFT_976165 [Mycena albidolilacea]|uniref:Uncharacterized protein n=1 Tax=Mycena albidolilacea TaxID=1033008 RepID=A0AAD6Z3Z8_9AGAR|nr:hypothetical protein DFH08DRAFT_976165 [Mycena albidolilacea]